MKGFIQAALAATLIAGATAQGHQHNHRHFHDAKKQERSPVEKRDADVTVTEIVPGPTVIEYVLNNKVINAEEAQEGLSEGLYYILGETTPTYVSPSSTPTPTPTPSTSSAAEAAQFFELLSTSSSSSSTPSPTPSSTSSAPASASASAAAGIDSDFPSGEIPCSTFPSDYGAVAVDYLGTNGWTSLQDPSSYTAGDAIEDIVEAVSGGCTTGMFCSYACPPGYEKSQWPESQGASGQSVGGLYCNEDGYLELTRTASSKICEAGAGGVYIKNELSEDACVCRTDYPGSESMVIPLVTSPGGTYPLTNPVEADYYMWEGDTTSAQYYVNNQGVAVDQACVWDSSAYPDSAGNWAPLNIGVGQDDTGTTYISIFPNTPTSNATLDFNIEITGDVTTDCYYKNGAFSSSDGCTASLTTGTAYIVFTSSD